MTISYLAEVVVCRAGVGAAVVESHAGDGVDEVGVDVAAVPRPLDCVHLGLRVDGAVELRCVVLHHLQGSLHGHAGKVVDVDLGHGLQLLPLPQGPVPHAAPVRRPVVLLGRHDGQHGDGGGVLVENRGVSKLNNIALNCIKIASIKNFDLIDNYRVSHPIVREISSCFVLGVPLPCFGSS